MTLDGFCPGSEHSLIKVMGVQMFLPRAVLQLKILPRSDQSLETNGITLKHCDIMQQQRRQFYLQSRTNSSLHGV